MLHSLKGIYLIFFMIVLPFYLCASNYYVDKNALGQNNGTSWVNAWKSFSAINWNLIQPGDIVYISGGTDSTVYYEQLNIQTYGSLNNYVNVRNSNDQGHSGKVIIDGNFVRDFGIYIEQGCGSLNRDWIYVKGFEVRRTASHGIYLHCNVNHIVIDSCRITETLGRSIMIIGNDDYYLTEGGICAENIEIKNCRAESHPDESISEDDVFYIQMVAGINIHHNYIHQQNRQTGRIPPDHMHIDCIQMHVTRDVKIWNNIAIIDSGVYGHAMILGIQSRPGEIDTNIIYNNYIYGGGHLQPGGNPNVPELYLRWYGYVNSVYPPTFVFHNTIVTANGGSYPIYHERPAQVKNNIIVQFGTNGQNPANYGGVGRPTWQGGYNSSWYNDADSSGNNLIWRDYSGIVFSGNRFRGSGGYPIGTPSGWLGWLNTYGGTGVNAYPEFVNNVRQRNGYVLNTNSPARNLGENLQSFIVSKGLPWSDINGNPRDSSPDIGAYQYSSGSDTTFFLSVQVINNFNLVSVPGINPEGMGVNTWWAYRDQTANVYKFANGYLPVTITTPGTGYWMKHSGNRNYNTGDEWPATGIQTVANTPINGTSGWNMIGGYDFSVSTSNLTTNPAGLISGPVYKFSTNYRPATTINPGYGYWIKLSGAGQIILPQTLEKGEEPREWFPEDWGKIIFTDAAGICYTLFAVKGKVDLNQYELPPAPLEGMFDIRFSSGRIAEDLENGEHIIEMTGIIYPISVKVENMNITLQDENGKQMTATLNNGEETKINDKSINKLKIVFGQIITPENYSLEQNFPNPFNPSTTIKFSLPEATHVILSIYNVLGEKLTELVNEKLEEGRHSYTWNVPQSGLATGLYIYELKTDKFISAKKMLLVK